MTVRELSNTHIRCRTAGCRRKFRIASVATSITACAEHQLRQRLRFRNTDINVRFDLSTGTITLRGQVASYYEKQLAQETVRKLEQVTRVINSVVVCQNLGEPLRSNVRQQVAEQPADGGLT